VGHRACGRGRDGLHRLLDAATHAAVWLRLRENPPLWRSVPRAGDLSLQDLFSEVDANHDGAISGMHELPVALTIMGRECC
jgi:hypothetical protein